MCRRGGIEIAVAARPGGGGQAEQRGEDLELDDRGGGPAAREHGGPRGGDLGGAELEQDLADSAANAAVISSATSGATGGSPASAARTIRWNGGDSAAGWSATFELAVEHDLELVVGGELVAAAAGKATGACREDLKLGEA